MKPYVKVKPIEVVVTLSLRGSVSAQFSDSSAIGEQLNNLSYQL